MSTTTTTAAALPREIPTPRHIPRWRSLLTLAAKDPLPFLLRLAREDGDLVRIPAGPLCYVLVQHPDLVRHVLQERHDNYRKSFNYEAMRLVVGEGLLTSEGDFWRRQRRLASPAFHRASLVQLSQTMASAAQEQAERWSALPDGAVLDVADELMRLTLTIVGRALFSVEVGGGDAEAFGKAVNVALHFIADRSRQLLRLPLAVPTPSHVRIRRALAVLDRIVYRIIAERRREQAGRHDLLALLMAARDEQTGESMSDVHLRDEVLTFLSAGHETTANALTWTLYLLSLHASERRKVEAELDEVLGGRAPSVEDLPRLERVRLCVEESMRLYPPAWFIERQANAEDELGGYRLPKNAVLGICAYTLHRDPRWFEGPESFDPDRFSAARSAARPKFAYLPFGGGPRTCIGAQFALWEAQLVLATLLQRFRLDLVPGHPVALDPLVTLRPKHGMKMALRRRAR